MIVTNIRDNDTRYKAVQHVAISLGFRWGNGADHCIMNAGEHTEMVFMGNDKMIWHDPTRNGYTFSERSLSSDPAWRDILEAFGVNQAMIDAPNGSPPPIPFSMDRTLYITGITADRRAAIEMALSGHGIPSWTGDMRSDGPVLKIVCGKYVFLPEIPPDDRFPHYKLDDVADRALTDQLFPVPSRWPIESIISTNLLNMIKFGEANPNLRGLIRAEILKPIPVDIISAGSASIINWIEENCMPRSMVPPANPVPTRTGGAVPLPAPPPAPAGETIEINDIEVYETETGRCCYTQANRYTGTLRIPLSEFRNCSDEDDVREVINEHIDQNYFELRQHDGEIDYEDYEAGDRDVNSRDYGDGAVNAIMERLDLNDPDE